MNLSVIIPNYNGKDLLSKNLPKVLDELSDYKNGKTEVIVTDDCSEDNSIEIIRKFPQVKLVTSPINTGFSSNVNRGVEKTKYEVLLLLNTDVYPDKGFLSPLLSHFEDENVFAVGCMDKSVEKEIVLRGRGVGKWQRGFLVHARGEVDKKDTLWVSGGSGAFRKSIWEKLGGLNRIYDPFYWEDIDLSFRAQKAGYKTIFEPKSTVWHEHEKGAIKKKYSPSQVSQIAYRNQFFFVWTNITDFVFILNHIFWLPYHLLKALINLDLAFCLGFLKALILFPKVIKSRYNNKKLFIFSDKQVIGLSSA